MVFSRWDMAAYLCFYFRMDTSLTSIPKLKPSITYLMTFFVSSSKIRLLSWICLVLCWDSWQLVVSWCVQLKSKSKPSLSADVWVVNLPLSDAGLSDWPHQCLRYQANLPWHHYRQLRGPGEAFLQELGRTGGELWCLFLFVPRVGQWWSWRWDHWHAMPALFAPKNQAKCWWLSPGPFQVWDHFYRHDAVVECLPAQDSHRWTSGGLHVPWKCVNPDHPFGEARLGERIHWCIKSVICVFLCNMPNKCSLSLAFLTHPFSKPRTVTPIHWPWIWKMRKPPVHEFMEFLFPTRREPQKDASIFWPALTHFFPHVYSFFKVYQYWSV